MKLPSRGLPEATSNYINLYYYKMLWTSSTKIRQYVKKNYLYFFIYIYTRCKIIRAYFTIGRYYGFCKLWRRFRIVCVCFAPIYIVLLNTTALQTDIGNRCVINLYFLFGFCKRQTSAKKKRDLKNRYCIKILWNSFLICLWW